MATVIFETRISAGADDVEQTNSGSIYSNSSDLELVTDGSDVQTIGLRFTAVEVPQDAIITAAWIQFQTDETGSDAASLTIRGEDSDDASAFAIHGSPYEVSLRPTTDASAVWTPEAWTAAGQAGSAQRTSDLSAIVQEIVARSGWTAFNDMVFVITGTGSRTAESFEGDANGAPLLHIEYTTAAPGGAPTLDLDGGSAGSGFAAVFEENGPAVAIAGLPQVSDPENDPIVGARIRLDNAEVGDALIVDAAALPSGIAVNAASTATDVTLTGTATAADYAEALRHITFTNGSETPAPAPRQISVTVSDGTATSAASVATIAIDRVPDAVDDQAATLANTPITLSDLLGNDDQGDGPATITSFDATTAQGGSVASGQGGSLVYTPPAGFIGEDRFSYGITDQDGDASSAVVRVSVTDPGTAPTVFETRITAGANDVEQANAGSIYSNSSDLELVADGSDVQTVGLRFTAVNVPKGAVVTAAWIQFKTDETGSGASSLTIWGEDQDDSAPFATSGSPFEVSSRTRTDASALWTPDPWTVVGEAGAAQRTADLSAVVQEIVGRAGWAALNDMSFIIAGSGRRTAESFEGDQAGAPLLHIEYTLPPPGNAPTLDLDSAAPGTGFDAVFHENGPATPIAGLPAISDPDGDPISGARIRLDDPKSGDALTIDAAALPAGITFDAGASSDTLLVLTGTASAAAYVQALQLARFSVAGDLPDPAARHVSVTVSDGTASSTAAVATIAIDRAPDASPDSVSTQMGVAVNTGNVLTNDDQGDGPATVTAFDTVSVSGGSITAAGASSFLYTPPAGFTGLDTFTYTIADSDGDTSTGTVSVNVTEVAANAPPTITTPAAISVPENRTAVLDIEATDDHDTEESGLVYSLTGGADQGAFVIDAATGALAFLSPPDFETKLDADGNGIYEVQVTVTDGGGLTDVQNIAVTVTDLPENVTPTTFEVRVNSGADDVEQFASGSIYTSSSDLELVVDNSDTQTVGIRFTGIDIPQGAIVTKAWIQFQTDEVSAGASSLTIRGQNADNAPAFTGTFAELASRGSTQATASWTPPDWTSVGAAGADQRTSDLSAILQEIVNRSGWQALNAMVFTVSGSGTRTAESFEGSASGAPLLHVEYLPPGETEAPQLDLDGAASGDGHSTVFKENGPAVAIAGDVAITDGDSANLTRAVVLLTDPKAGDALSVTGGLPAGINVDSATTASRIVLTGSASLADYQTALENIRFANSSETPNPTPRHIEVTVSDSISNSNVAVSTISIDRTPDTMPDGVSTPPDTPVVVNNVMANDDPGDGPATVTGFDAVSVAGGSVASAGPDSFLYTPPAGFAGLDSFTYTIADSDGDAATGTVNVAVGVNAAPTDVTLTVDGPLIENKAGAVVGILSASDPDPGDTHTFSVDDPRFEVLGNVLKLRDEARIDYEKEAEISLHLTATDIGGLQVTRTVTASVGDVAEARFAAFGDWPAGDGTQAVADLIEQLGVDFIITTGDNIYDPDASVDAQIGSVYSDYIGGYAGAYGSGSSVNRFFPAIGNHEYEDGRDAEYFSYFDLPGNERYYDFVEGPVHFFAVNANTFEPDGVTANSVQAQWLRDGLAVSDSPINIVYLHQPPYSSGGVHGSTTQLQWPFEDWGATAVLAGHDHDYERILRDDDGDGTTLPYFVTGLGGNETYAFGTPVEGSAARYNGDYGTMLIQASNTSVTFEFWSIADGGTLIDSYTIDLPAGSGGGSAASVVAQYSMAAYGIPDPAGLAYDPVTDSFLLSDSERDEEPNFNDVDIFRLSRAGVLEEAVLPAYTREPTGLAIDSGSGLMFVSDDDVLRVFAVDPANPGTALHSFDTAALGAEDPEDVAVDAANDRLFILSGETDHRIVETDYAGSQVFSTLTLPEAWDPEALAYDPAEDVFYVGSGTSDHIWKVARNGALLRDFDVLETLDNPINGESVEVKDIELAPASDGSGETHIYIADYGLSHVMDGRLIEVDPGDDAIAPFNALV